MNTVSFHSLPVIIIVVTQVLCQRYLVWLTLIFFSFLFFNPLLSSSHVRKTWFLSFLFLSRNTPILMTCSWEEKRFSPELRESTMLSCWQKEPSTIRSVRKRDVSISFWGALSEIQMICLPLLAISGTTLENFCASPLFVVQIWRRSRHTSTPSGMELPHMAAEALVRNMFCRGNYRNGFCFFVRIKNW